MLQHTFDDVIDRRNTASVKWRKYSGRDVIPMWVADMDFKAPPAVLDALHARVDHGVFGYDEPTEELADTVTAMLRREYEWQVNPQWLVWLPCLVAGLNVACRAVGCDSDEVMTAVPTYPPFLRAPAPARKKLTTVPLHKCDGRWAMDFDRIEDAISSRTRLFILCNPHNPVGRVYTPEELSTLADICRRHDIVVCSDEIHCGLILDEGKKHLPFATLGGDIGQTTITLMSPSKTFNIPGLGCGFAVISNSTLRDQFRRAMVGVVSPVNSMGLAAAVAAYRDCRPWHQALLEYLRENRDIVEQDVAKIDGLVMSHIEATYLAWIDLRKTKIGDPAAFLENAGVGLSDGRDFGSPGFVRLNFGCSRSVLCEALARIKKAMEAGL